MSHEERDYIAILHEHGFRATPQRLTILDAICDIGGHATLEAIMQRVQVLDPAISPSTVYRALDVLCEAKLITAAETSGDGKGYEIIGVQPHHHLVCEICGKTQIIEQVAMSALFAQFEERYGFIVTSDHLILQGKCVACHSSEK